MWAVQFFVYALIVFLLVMMFGGTMIGYYFAKKAEYEQAKTKGLAEAFRSAAQKAEHEMTKLKDNLTEKNE